jgi:hypothetical protein
MAVVLHDVGSALGRTMVAVDLQRPSLDEGLNLESGLGEISILPMLSRHGYRNLGMCFGELLLLLWSLGRRNHLFRYLAHARACYKRLVSDSGVF